MTSKEKFQALKDIGIFHCMVVLGDMAYCYLLDPKFGRNFISRYQNVYYWYAIGYYEVEPLVRNPNRTRNGTWQRPNCKRISFEEVLQDSSPEIQEKLLFNLDLFL